MRGFELQDTFKLSEIIDVMEIEVDLNEMLDKAKEGKVQETVGGQFALLFIKKLHKAKTQIVEFIANVTGEEIEVVKKYKPKEIKTFFIDLFGNDDFKDFFN